MQGGSGEGDGVMGSGGVGVYPYLRQERCKAGQGKEMV